MTPIELARSYLGTKELKGSADNPKIMEMYRTVGHDWVEHDEVAWCAAFVGHCLEKAGLASTRKLNARSYLMWGEKVAGPEQAKEGDIVIFTRGPGTAQGHVAFFLKAAGRRSRCWAATSRTASPLPAIPSPGCSASGGRCAPMPRRARR